MLVTLRPACPCGKVLRAWHVAEGTWSGDHHAVSGSLPAVLQLHAASQAGGAQITTVSIVQLFCPLLAN